MKGLLSIGLGASLLVASVAFAESAAPAAAAGGDDMSKMMCSSFFTQQGEGLIKRGQTLQKGGKLKLDGAKAMKKAKLAEGAIVEFEGRGMLAAGKVMEANGKKLVAMAAKVAKKGDHSAADHIAAFGKFPAEWRKKHLEDSKAFMGEMKEWAGEMTKMAEMMGGMLDKLEKAGDAAK